MTVLTWRAGVLAADRRVVFDEDVRQGPMRKLAIGQTEDFKFAAAACGDSESDAQVIELAQTILTTRRRPKPMKGGLTLLIAAAPKRARLNYRLLDVVIGPETSLAVYSAPHLPPYLARGSGGPIALGHMAADKDAIAAVYAAAKHSTLCGDGVNFVDTNKPLDKWRILTRKGKGA